MRDRAVFFDLDDTLYDFGVCNQAAEEASVAYLREQLGYQGDRRAYHKSIYRYMDAIQERLGSDNLACHSRTLRNAMFLEEEGYPASPHAGRLEEIYWEVIFRYLAPEPGIIGLLKELKKAGVYVGIGTNLTAFPQYQKIARLGLSDLISQIIPSELAGFEKPSAGFFAYCAREADVDPRDCVFIGDNFLHDVTGSRALGMKGVLYAPDRRPMSEEVAEQVAREQIPVIRDYRDPMVLELLEIS